MQAVFYSGMAICCFAALQNALWAFSALRPKANLCFALLSLSVAVSLYLNLQWLGVPTEPLATSAFGLLSVASLVNIGLLLAFVALFVEQALTKSLLGVWVLLLLSASAAHGLSVYAAQTPSAEQAPALAPLMHYIGGDTQGLLGFMLVFACLALSLVMTQVVQLFRMPRLTDAFILMTFLLAQTAAVIAVASAGPVPSLAGYLPVMPMLGLVVLFSLRLGSERLNLDSQMERERAVSEKERMERRKLEVSMQNIAYSDPLTVLPNRVAFLEKTNALLEGEQQPDLQIYLLGINHFKDVNNAYGQSVGDELLRLVADRLRSHFHDTLIIARVAGDLFALLVEEAPAVDEDSDAPKPRPLDEVLLSVLRMPYRVFDFSVKLDFGLGVVLSKEVKLARDAHSLLIDAEYAMQHAKMGSGGVAFFDASIKEAKAREHRLVTALRGAESRGELELLYQVKVNDQAEVVGMEALIRWYSPEFGLVPTEEFIQLAERYGLINPVGEWVALRVCQQVAEWLSAGLSPGRISFNVSPYQLKAPGFSSLMRALVNKYRLPTEHLEVEVTESALIEDFEHSKVELNALREMGFHISIDDFGTGYSSLSYLGQLPLDTLKIDKSFVDNILEQEGAEMVRSIIHVGRAFGCDIIAEGVETQAQLNALKALGCTKYQGYFFSHPLTTRDVRKILSASNGVFDDRKPALPFVGREEQRSSGV